VEDGMEINKMLIHHFNFGQGKTCILQKGGATPNKFILQGGNVEATSFAQVVTHPNIFE